MEYDLVIERVTQYGSLSFKVQHQTLTDRYGGYTVWPSKMIRSQGMSLYTVATLVLKRNLGFAEANRLKEACEKAWGTDAQGLNYNVLPRP
jgi:hypothetical protein